MTSIANLPDLIPYKEIEDAREKIKGHVLQIPLVPLNIDWPHGKIYLKLENLQPIGCFKLRGACNAIACMEESEMKQGVYTASAGNFAQGLAYCTKKFGIPCDVFVPDHAPSAKVDSVHRLGGEIHKITFDDWWEIIKSHRYNGMNGKFIHPVSDRSVIAGNGTAGLEIYEDLPDVDAVIVPYGGGGFSCGIASALHHVKPTCKVFASEVETAAPLSASFKEGKPTTCPYTASFVDGIGGKSVLEEMWPMVKHLLSDSLVVTLRETADALKLLAEKNHVIAEGAGASSVAAALSGKAGNGNIVCVISGGNIDTPKLVDILQGNIP
ncbi:L-threonine dehydratase catabolic TdcB-like [Mercenaria mercenaria]|uniref:L-threonine dehydratase catabolic TdcB-like n=1 Tax=Mercenaria mercenaria TaxID=6596 RepID=UPI00234F3D60|nr:L-threonine dehydratase catabolic TdcB-like [Mercenaria mercenaria]XP_045213314.2 L-threonine dehydratase catabolic TdcB-like [Mercenaria mercenaria]XP_053392742.1 L-threonine dehydratase catabolic TdcB-like [Mercenaria mercenaria]